MRDAATPDVPTSSSCLDSTSPTEHLCRAPTNMKALQQQGRALFGPLLILLAGRLTASPPGNEQSMPAAARRASFEGQAPCQAALRSSGSANKIQEQLQGMLCRREESRP